MINNNNSEKELKLYNLTVQVKCVDKVKARYCMGKMLDGLTSESIWFCNKVDIQETIKSLYDLGGI